MHDEKRAAEMPPKPSPERHDSYGGHDAVWLITSCGHEAHPYYWTCSVCGEGPVA